VVLIPAEHHDVFCRSMPRTLADAAARGWAVVGASAEKEAVPVSHFKVDRPTVLVMGESRPHQLSGLRDAGN
jgi:tRNA G18 (ribose-2'-O)-methylase SpoU